MAADGEVDNLETPLGGFLGEDPDECVLEVDAVPIDLRCSEEGQERVDFQIPLANGFIAKSVGVRIYGIGESRVIEPLGDILFESE